jgi:hypothetical protein
MVTSDKADNASGEKEPRAVISGRDSVVELQRFQTAVLFIVATLFLTACGKSAPGSLRLVQNQ